MVPLGRLGWSWWGVRAAALESRGLNVAFIGDFSHALSFPCATSTTGVVLYYIIFERIDESQGHLDHCGTFLRLVQSLEISRVLRGIPYGQHFCPIGAFAQYAAKFDFQM